MTPFVANLLVGAILALVTWAVGFGVYVIRQDRAREREINGLKVLIAGLEARFVTQVAWTEFNHNFDLWKTSVLEKIGGLAIQLASLGAKSPQQ